MFKLEKLNVVRLVDSEHARDLLLADGFSLVEEAEDEGVLEAEDLLTGQKAEESEEPKTEAMDVDGMTVKELQEYLVQRGIEFKAGATKVELLKLAYGQ